MKQSHSHHPSTHDCRKSVVAAGTGSTRVLSCRGGWRERHQISILWAIKSDHVGEGITGRPLYPLSHFCTARCNGAYQPQAVLALTLASALIRTCATWQLLTSAALWRGVTPLFNASSTTTRACVSVRFDVIFTVV